MKLAIVILNWNGKKFLEKFLSSLVARTPQWAEIIVADNASTDDSLLFLQENYPSIRIIRNDRNYGFASGYNMALAQVEAEYYCLLNSDIEVAEGWVEPVIELLDNDETIAAVQPKILSFSEKDRFEYAGACGGFIDQYGYPFCRGRVFGTLEKDHGQYDTRADIFWATGAALFVRSSVYRTLGGLDDDFFAHMEEIDLCWRMQLRGWKVNIVPESFVYHIGGGTLPNESPFKLRLNFRNNLLLLENNLPATFVALGLPEQKARQKARKRILARMCLDGASALTYLITRRWSFYRAVVTAHQEYRKLRRPGPIPGTVSVPEGLVNKAVVLKALLGKK